MRDRFGQFISLDDKVIYPSWDQDLLSGKVIMFDVRMICILSDDNRVRWIEPREVAKVSS